MGGLFLNLNVLVPAFVFVSVIVESMAGSRVMNRSVALAYGETAAGMTVSRYGLVPSDPCDRLISIGEA